MNWIKSNLTKQSPNINQEPENKEEVDDSPECRFSFFVDKTGNIDFEFSWNEEDEKTSKDAAAAIAMIQNGFLKNKVFSILSEIEKQMPESKQFIQNLIDEWLILESKLSIAKDMESKKQSLRPSEVFNNRVHQQNKRM